MSRGGTVKGVPERPSKASRDDKKGMPWELIAKTQHHVLLSLILSDVELPEGLHYQTVGAVRFYQYYEDMENER